MECVHTTIQVNTFANTSQNYKKKNTYVVGQGPGNKWAKKKNINNLKVKSQFVAFSAF